MAVLRTQVRCPTVTRLYVLRFVFMASARHSSAWCWRSRAQRRAQRLLAQRDARLVSGPAIAAQSRILAMPSDRELDAMVTTVPLDNRPTSAVPGLRFRTLSPTRCSDYPLQSSPSVYIGMTARLGTPFWAHVWAHSGRFCASSVRNPKENEAMRRFFRPPLLSGQARLFHGSTTRLAACNPVF